MQEPADNMLATPSIDVLVEVSEVARTLGESEALNPDEPLNRAERIAADFGAWVVTVAVRWNLQSSPCFVADGRSLCDVLEPAPLPTKETPTAIIH